MEYLHIDALSIVTCSGYYAFCLQLYKRSHGKQTLEFSERRKRLLHSSDCSNQARFHCESAKGLRSYTRNLMIHFRLRFSVDYCGPCHFKNGNPELLVFIYIFHCTYQCISLMYSYHSATHHTGFITLHCFPLRDVNGQRRQAGGVRRIMLLH